MAYEIPLPWDPIWRTEIGPDILDQLQPHHNPEGINTERVEQYIQALGMPSAHYVILEEEMRGQVSQVFGRHGLSLYPNDLGRYHEAIDAAVIFKQSDTAETELTTVHELAHVKPQINKVATPNSLFDYARFLPEVYKVRQEIKRGAFREEGAVSMLAGVYRQLIMGFPKRYVSQDGAYGFAALAMETLCAQEPDLFDAFIASRSDRAAIPRIAESFNNIQPGLQKQLDRISKDDGSIRIQKAWFKGMERAFKATGHAALNSQVILDAQRSSTIPDMINVHLTDHEQRTGYTFT